MASAKPLQQMASNIRDVTSRLRELSTADAVEFSPCCLCEGYHAVIGDTETKAFYVVISETDIFLVSGRFY